ncbi:MAG: hypothetical protein IT557_13085 [Alphaproteobacteria bacterium]|nr:hypothetical protein [Alphaproteobacteria bacterium]
MADSVSAASVSASLAGIESRIADLRQQLREGGALAEGGADLVQGFRKDTRDVAFDNAANARDIGILIRNDSRLNVVSSLARGDAVDVFRFRVATAGALRLGQIGDAAVRVQILTRAGVLVADNAPSAEARHQARFAAFRSEPPPDGIEPGSNRIETGEYVLRISRIEGGAGATEAKPRNYAIQLGMGGYRRDFDTVERNRAPGAAPDPGAPAGLAGFTQMMTDGLAGLQRAAVGAGDAFAAIAAALFGAGRR